MLVNFWVENFKSIHEPIQLSFEADNSKELEEYYVAQPIPNSKLRVLKLAIIYGPNASGKTNILEALDFLREIVLYPFIDKTETFDSLGLNPFKGAEETKDKNSVFKIEFIVNRKLYIYSVELNNKAIVKESLYRYTPKKARVFERETDINKQYTKIKFGSTVKISKADKESLENNTLWNNTVLGGFLKTNLDLEEMKNVTEWFRVKLTQLIKPYTILAFSHTTNRIQKDEKSKANIIQFMKSADLWIDDIIIKKEEREIPPEVISLLKKTIDLSGKESSKDIDKIEKEKKVEIVKVLFKHKTGSRSFILDLEEESAGTQRYYELCGVLDTILNEDVIIPIDEIESSLHPELIINFLVSFLELSRESQLIVTTHYRELLKERDMLRSDAIWFTDKKEDGSTDLYSLSDFDSKTIRKVNSIYNAYKIGKFGAVPEVKNIGKELCVTESERKEV